MKCPPIRLHIQSLLHRNPVSSSRILAPFRPCPSSLRSPPIRQASQSASPALAPLSSFFQGTADLTPAQASRAAAQAIRLSARSHAFGDALHILNSLQTSHHLFAPAHATHSVPPQSHSAAPLAPRPSPSPRLSAHCFLHGLLRSGRARQAARFSEMMIQQGVRLGSPTLQVIMQELTRPILSSTPSVRSFVHTGPLRSDVVVPTLLSSRVSDPSCQAAIRILEQARHYNHRRTQQMYDVVIRACLRQGEIIVASLLFVLLVKEFATTSHKADEANTALSQRQRTSSPCYSHFPLDTMKTVLDHTSRVLLRDPQNAEDEAYMQYSLQALANLAMLLEEGHDMSGQISPLLRALYSCPKTTSVVWIIRDGRPKQVAAYPYFQRILMRLIGRMRDPASPGPMLSLRSYNALLHYALRHRLAPHIANTILEHMTQIRQPPLRPDIVTYNTLLRSASVLRSRDLTDTLLQTLQLSAATPVLDSTASRNPLADGRDPAKLPLTPRSSIRKAIFGLKRQRLHTSKGILEHFARLQPDIYTLTTYMSTVTKSGNPAAVKDLLFRLIPELSMFLDANTEPSMRRKLYETCLKRAVVFGPQFFSAALNALVKAGLTGLVERVFMLAQQAQYASWIPHFVKGVSPWRLSIHAYTALMQCYVAETKKAPLRRSSVSLLPRMKTSVVGYARRIYTRQQMQQKRRWRWKTGRRLGMLLFKDVVSDDKGLSRMAVTLMRTTVKDFIPPEAFQHPSPDGRFFNATLDILHWTRKAQDLERSRDHPRAARMKTKLLTSSLRQVASAIARSNYRLPFSLLCKTGAEVKDLEVRPYKVLDRTPFVFSPVVKGRGLHRIPVMYSRALPMGRRVQFYMRRARKQKAARRSRVEAARR